MVWAEQTVPSSVAALIISIEPLWFVIFDWLFFKSRKPTVAETLGVILGFGGTVFLVLDQAGYSLSLSGTHTVGMLIVLAATVNWSMGALYSRRAPVAKSSLLSTAMQMSAGGIVLLAASFIAGEPARISLDAISPKSVAALAYLVVFGSLMGFTGLHLAAEGGPRFTGDHPYVVNPLVAISSDEHRGETISGPMLTAATVIIFSVILITRTHPPTPEEQPGGEEGQLEEQVHGNSRSTWETTSGGVSSAAASR